MCLELVLVKNWTVFVWLRKGLAGLVAPGVFVLHFLRDLMYGPDGRPSLLATITFGMFSLFAFVTLYLVLTGTKWEYYTSFATTTTTLSTIGKAADKFMNNRFSSGGDA